MEEPNKIIGFLQRRWLLIAGLAVFLIVAFVLYNLSFITIEVSGSTLNKEISYSLLNQNNKSLSIARKKPSSFTKFVPRGDYQILVRQDGQSGFAVTKTKGFLRKTVVSISLKPQIKRRFVGNGPGACMSYVSGVLYSYSCSGSDTAKAHLPATGVQPSYNSNVSLDIGQVEGIVNTDTEVVALAHSVDEEGGELGPHTAYVLGAGFTPTIKKSLNDLDIDAKYSILASGKGFIVYDESFSDIKYYGSISDSPKSLNLGRPSDLTQRPLAISASDSSVLAEYSNKADAQEESTGKGVGKAKSTLLLYKAGRSSEIHFKKQFESIALCGTNKLCLLDIYLHRLFVYEANSKPKLLYTIENINSIKAAGKNILLVRDKSIIDFDVDKQSGHEIYSSNNYSFCGLQKDKDSYLLCAAINGQSMVLRLDPTTQNDDSIDEKIGQIAKLGEIDDLSIYGNYVYIFPDYGELIYSSDAGGYVYNPVVKDEILPRINQAIKDSGIDRSKYTIVINGAQ